VPHVRGGATRDSIELLAEKALVASGIGNSHLDKIILVASYEMRFEHLRAKVLVMDGGSVEPGTVLGTIDQV
jgi:hypothetical protein